MQSTMNPISPVGRAVLPTMQGASPDEINQLAADAEKSGLLSFADALGIKRMADMISKSGAQDPRTQDPRRKPVVQELRDAINAVLNPPAAPPAMNAGVAALPMPDDMYADVGMAGGGIVAFQEGGLNRGPYQPPQRVPYEESYFGKYLGVPIGGFFSRIAESLAERQLNEADLRRQAVANIFGGELPPAAPVEQSSEIRLPTTNQEALEMGINPMGALASRTMGQTPIPRTPAPTAAAPGATPDLRPGDKAPPPALRAAPPAPTGPTAPTGIAALIPKPDLKAIQAEVDKSYRGAQDVYKQREASLQQREGELEKLLGTSKSESLMDFGLRLMEAGGPGVTFLEALGTAGRGYREERREREKELVEAQNRLDDARFEVNDARAQLGVTQSDKVYERLNKATEVYLDEQKRVQELQQAERDRQDKLAIYGTEIEKARLARGISDIDERLFGMAKDDPLRPSLQAQRESLMGTLNTLTGDSYTNDIRQQQLIVQATDDIKKTPEYEAAALSASSAYNSLASLDPEDDEEEYNKAMDRYTAAKTRMDEILKTGLSQLGLSPLGGSVKPEDLRRMVGD